MFGTTCGTNQVRTDETQRVDEIPRPHMHAGQYSERKHSDLQRI